MGRRIAPLALLGLLLGAIALAGVFRPEFSFDVSAAGLLQQGSPAASPVPDAVNDAITGLPGEIDIHLIASSEQTGLPANGLVLSLERIEFAAGESLANNASGAELIAVDEGSVVLAEGANFVELATGGQHQVATDARYRLEAGESGAVVLRLRLGKAVAPVAPGDKPQGSPVSGPVPKLLFEGKADGLVSRRGTLFLARVALTAGGTTGHQVFSGPVGIAVESGSLSVSGEQAAALSIAEGHSAFLPGYKAFEASNTGDDAAVLLVGGLLAPPRGGADAPSATPTPAVDAQATSQALIDDLSGNVATLTEQQIQLEATIAAQETALAEAESAQATAEAALNEAAVNAQVGQATAASDLEQTEAELIVAQTQIAEGDAERATAEAQLTSVSNDLATAQAAATTVAESARAAESTHAGETAALESTVVALQTEVAEGAAGQASAEATIESLEASSAEQSATLDSANATIAAQATAQADLANQQATTEADTAAAATAAVEQQAVAQATAAAQASAIASGNATADAQSSAIASGNATADAQASAIASGDATADAQASAIASGDATVAAQASAITSGNAAATAQAESAVAEASAAAANLAASEATSQANADALSQAQADAAASATAQAEAASAAAATAGADASAAAATVAAQSEEITALEASLASTIGDLADANATIVAQSTALAESESVAGASVEPAFVDLSIQVDLDQVLAGNQAAVQAAQDALEAVLQPYASCRAAIVLTFGHGNTIGQGTQLAAAINAIIQAEESDIFSGAAFDAYGDLRAPLGQVDLRIYFFTGCEPEPVEETTAAN